MGWNEACLARKEARLAPSALDWVGSMKARTSLVPILSLAAAFGLVGAVACTLNPQPLPPDDDRVNAVPTSPGGSAFSDSGQNAPPDARKDSGPVGDAGPVGDGGLPVFDGAVDAQVDGGDGGTTSLDATPD